jgi:hypothetical protein
MEYPERLKHSISRCDIGWVRLREHEIKIQLSPICIKQMESNAGRIRLGFSRIAEA